MIPGDVNLSGGSYLTVGSLNVPNINANASTLNAYDITVSGNVSLLNGARLTVPYASNTLKKVYDLKLNVANTLTVDATSLIDLNYKGYLYSYRSGPDYVYTTARSSCYGGKRRNVSTDCTYGRYQQARFAGSSGLWQHSTRPAHGGGLATITANSVLLDGTIRANGREGYHVSNTNTVGGSGAGGGIHLEAATLSGSGKFQAVGGGSGYNYDTVTLAGGGRISLHLGDRSGWTGTMTARGGWSATSYTAGAGTFYTKLATETHGRLYVSNDGRKAAAGSTPITNIGRRAITDVTQVDATTWTLTVDGTPWKATNTALDWGLQGMEVDVDAADGVNTTFTIASTRPTRLL